MDFESFGKIPRLLNTPMVITEKIDGTNAQIYISDDGTELVAGSRSRFITPENDNFGFAGWVLGNRDSLMALGPGRHFGEWWGRGIQRGYGLAEKRFSLFNTSKWSENRPECTGVVPVLFIGNFSVAAIEDTRAKLLETGSVAAPGYMNPEGVIVYLPKANMLFKCPFKEEHKQTLVCATEG